MRVYARITDFNDSVAVFMFEDFNGNINLWTLDDEACLHGGGVKASWTLMLSTNVGGQIIYVEGLFNRVEFLLMTGDGEKLLFDSKSKRTKYIPDVPFFGFREVFKFTESLVSVAGSR